MKRKEIKKMERKKVFKGFLKKAVAGAFLIGSLMVAGGPAASTEIPETIDINTQKTCPDLDGIKKDIKHVNGFTHKAHIKYLKGKTKEEFVCATCHHGAKTEKDITEGDKCKRLADEFKEEGGAKNLKNYFHHSCLKCHKDLKKKGEPTGPVSCKGCHNRKGGEK